jgi:hypothetical protein
MKFMPKPAALGSQDGKMHDPARPAQVVKPQPRSLNRACANTATSRRGFRDYLLIGYGPPFTFRDRV